MSQKKYFSTDEQKQIIDKISVLDYFKILELKGEVKFTRKSGKDYYFETEFNKYSVSNDKFYDFKTGQGGQLIKAVMQLENKTWIEALNTLNEIAKNNTNIIEFNPEIYLKEETKNKPEIISIKKPHSENLLSYFENRGIEREILRKYTKELKYKIKDKTYYGLAIKNQSNGYEIRNPFIKTKIGKNDYSIIQEGNKNELIVFEGMTDALSFLQLLNDNDKTNFRTLICLNSITNSSSFIHDYNDYKGKIYLLLDGDKQGNDTTQKIKSNLKFAKIADIRQLYNINKHVNNDLNDYLRNKKNKINLSNEKKNENETNYTSTGRISNSQSMGSGTSIKNNYGTAQKSKSEQQKNKQSRFDVAGQNVRNGHINAKSDSGQSISRKSQPTPSEEQKNNSKNAERETAVESRVRRLKDSVLKRPINENITELVSLLTNVNSKHQVEIIYKSELSDDLKKSVSNFVPGGKLKIGRGVLDEYYTEDILVNEISNLLRQYFEFDSSKRILEPSVGTGNFINAIPYTSHKNVDAFEINATTAAIAKIRFPEINVNLRSFESLFMTETGKKLDVVAKYDLVIGNPPYGLHRGLYKGLGEESKIRRYEDYFIKRSIDVLKENGVLAMVLPSGWINRQKELKNADLLEAFRLPTGSFKGTDIGTDIIFLRKSDNKKGKNISNYFENKPEHILGTIKEKTNRFGKTEEYVSGTLISALTIIRDLKSIQDNSKQLSLFSNVDISDSKHQYEVVQNEIDIAKNPDQNEEELDILFSDTYLKQTEPEIIPKHLKYHFDKNDEIISLSDLSEKNTYSDKELQAFKSTGYDGRMQNYKTYIEFANYINGNWIHDFYYTEGNIITKLKQLELDYNSKNSPIDSNQYKKQKMLLENALPKQKSLDEIIISPNHEFVHNLILGQKEKEFMNYSKNEYEMRTYNYTLADKFKDFISTLKYEAFEGSSEWEVRGFVDNVSVTGSDRKRNALVKERRKEAANNLFKKFLHNELDKSTQDLFVKAFNENYNNTNIPDYSKFPTFAKIHKNFKGNELKLTEVQKAGIGQLTTKGVGVLAHEVGFGKTLSGILTLHEAMHRNYAKRPLIVVPNENIMRQWIETIFETIPNAKVNVLGNLGVKYDLSNFKVNDGDITIVTYSGFNNIGFDIETTKKLASKFSYISENETKSLKYTEREKQLDISKQEELQGVMRRGKIYHWDDFGFDHLTFDEIHNANHIIGKVKIEDRRFSSDFRSQQQLTSQLGINTWMASQYIQDQNHGRNVTLLSATPFTNKPLEYYSILSLVANKKLEESGFFNINTFFETFMEADNEMEIDALGEVKFKANVRRFKNNTLFQKLLAEFINIKGSDNPDLIRPERHNKEYKSEQNQLTKVQINLLNDSYDSDEDGAILTHILNSRLIAISPYLSPHYSKALPDAIEFIENSPKLLQTMELIKQNKSDQPAAGQIIYSELAIDQFQKLQQYLIEKIGFNHEEVQIITGKTNKIKRLQIQDDFNSGKVKIIIGSSAIQEGLNLQQNATDLYLLTLPYNFTSLRQVEGRVWRQGNRWPNVRVNYMLTNDTIDVFMLQKLQSKQARYNEAMLKGADILDISDIDTSELKTALITSPITRAKIEIKILEEKLQKEKQKYIADNAFVLRKYDIFLDAQKKISDLQEVQKRYIEYANKDSVSSYWENEVKRQEKLILSASNQLDEIIIELNRKGVNVKEIQNQTEFTKSKIDEIENQIKNLDEVENNLIEKYTIEKDKKQLSIDSEAYIRERKKENEYFYGPEKRAFYGQNIRNSIDLIEKKSEKPEKVNYLKR